MAAFTGLVRSFLHGYQKESKLILLIESDQVEFFKNVREESSISVNGTCLSVSSIKRVVLNNTEEDNVEELDNLSEETNTKNSPILSLEYRLEFFVMEETLNVTNFSSNSYSKYNVELARIPGEPNEGHNVTGHVDDVCKIELIDKRPDGSVNFWLKCNNIELIERKNSISLDGISLTIADVNEENKTFRVSIKPKTLERTTISFWNVGSLVNVEYNNKYK